MCTTYLEHLEERSLSRVASRGTRGYLNIDGGNRTHTGRRRHTVLLDHVANRTKVTVREDETHVSDHLGQKLKN